MESCSRAIYYYLQMRTSLRLEDVAKKPEGLVGFLREMFRAEAQVLERRVSQELCAEFGINPGEIEGADLASLIKRILSRE